MKNILLLDNYYSSDDLRAEIEAFVEYYSISDIANRWTMSLLPMLTPVRQ